MCARVRFFFITTKYLEARAAAALCVVVGDEAMEKIVGDCEEKRCESETRGEIRSLYD